MTTNSIIDLRPLAAELHLDPQQVLAAVALLDAGNTIPFITRYRKDQTGGLNEERIRAIQLRVEKLRLLAQRKQTILKSIESQQKLTPELAAAIDQADSFKRLEDLYLPYKPKKQTLATLARERGLELLADEILQAAPSCANLDARAQDFANPDRQVASGADALLGAGHIIAERFSERSDLRQRLRAIVETTGRLVSTKAATDETKPTAEKAPDTAAATAEGAAEGILGEAAPAEMGKPQKTDKNQRRPTDAFRDFHQFSESLAKIPPHRVLAINRGERAKILRVRVEADEQAMTRALEELLVPPDHPHAAFLRGCALDALQRLIFPSLEREVRRELTDNAEAHAVTVFARNLRNLLLQSPVRDRRVLAIDPGYKSGCKAVALDEFGTPLGHVVVHITGKDPEKRAATKAALVELINQHQCSVVAIGNGTASRDTEAVIAEIIAENATAQPLAYVFVNEAGASVYSTSPVGREEFPHLDATIRSAISIGRRLQDPLSELVKIEPANIGVGMYQHDVKAKHLETSLDAVVQSCVNYVGVDVNTASVSLLRYVSGLNQLTARRLYEHRRQYGPFKNRAEFLNVSGLGDATFVQAAGFLRITGGDNPLDGTWIHPESYPIAEKVLAQIGFTKADLADKQRAEELARKVAALDVAALAQEWNVGQHLLRDILCQLTRPGRDPREDLPPPLFKREILKLEDLQPGMELAGSVLNVVDFGVFVDIGLKDSGLVHISQLSSEYVADPHTLVAVGDVVRVWVLAVDKERRRVSLTMIPPGTARSGGRRPHGERPAERRGAEGQGPAEQTADRPPRKRPPRRREARHPVGAAVAEGGEATAAEPPQGSPAPQRRFDRSRNRQGGQQGDRGSGRDQGGQGQGGQGQRGQGQSGHGQGRQQAGQSQPARAEKRKFNLPPPKLTKAMREGREPLRTFGQLMQFYQTARMETPPLPPAAAVGPAAQAPPAESESAPAGPPPVGTAPVASAPSAPPPDPEQASEANETPSSPAGTP